MPHIVVVPFPAQGHINPCVTFANLLIPHGFTFTFVIPQHLAPSLPNPNPNPPNEKQPPAPPIRYVSIPAISMDEAARMVSPSSLRLPQQLEMVKSMRPGFEDLAISQLSDISCVIGDCFIPWVSEVSLRLGLPFFLIYTTNAHAISCILHIEELIARGASPMSDPQQIVDFVPGLLPKRAVDLPQSIRTLPSFVLDMKKEIIKGAGLILNTVYELEQESIDVISQTVPTYPIGPMLLMSSHSNESMMHNTVTLWAEDRQCITWLDNALPSSVLYISFGSLANFSVHHIKELAEGLEVSNQPFLWVIRPGAVEGHLSSDMLLQGFAERTKGRGLIISWAPQLEVLSHPSVGGFLTHCGWNSITENISTGCVPMICWPQIAEQRLNARILVDEWKIALELEPENGDIMKAATVHHAVIKLMRGDIGREIKNRTLSLKELVSQSIQEGGSSHRYLQSLVQDIKKVSRMPKMKTM